MKQKWEIAADKFIAKYKNKPWFEGAVLCGSYVSGNANEDSDIDIHIITSNTQDWRERGNMQVDGFIVEYFINPIYQLKEYFEKDYDSNRFATATMIGYILTLLLFHFTKHIKWALL